MVSYTYLHHPLSQNSKRSENERRNFSAPNLKKRSMVFLANPDFAHYLPTLSISPFAVKISGCRFRYFSLEKFNFLNKNIDIFCKKQYNVDTSRTILQHEGWNEKCGLFLHLSLWFVGAALTFLVR